MKAFRGRRRIQTLQAACDRFMQSHKVGDTIRAWPGAMGVGPGELVIIRPPGAYVLSGHTAVVQVSGGHGCIALSHIVESV